MLIGLTALQGTAHAAALLVTMTSGNVHLLTSAGKAPAPAPAFPVLTGQKLVLADGATAVVMHPMGGVHNIVGPRTVTPADVRQRTKLDQSSPELGFVFAPREHTTVSTSMRGAGGFSLRRPIESTAMVMLREIRWRCGECDPLTVEVLGLPGAESLWTGTGTGAVSYDGPTLVPGTYGVRANDQIYAFVIAPAATQQEVAAAADQARALARELPLPERTSVEAGVWGYLGMPTEALSVIDRALAQTPNSTELQALRRSYESAAGLPE